MGLGLNSYSPVERNSINAVWQRRLGPAQIKDHRFLIIEIKKTLSTEHTQNSWRSKMEEGTTSQKGMPQTSLLESILAERGMHTQKGFWDIPNTGSEPGKSNDWPNEAQKKCTIKDIQTTMRVWLSLCACLCVYPRIPYSFLINTLPASLLSIFMWKFISTQLAGQGLVTDHWSLVARTSHYYSPTSISGQELKPCFKLLQA